MKKFSDPKMENQPYMNDQSPEVEEINDYFMPGFDPDDIPSLWKIKQNLSLLNAFTTIFRGDPTGISVRLHVLSEMSLRPADNTSWDVTELRQNFAYLTDTAFDTVVRRLRGGILISYDREKISYSVTPLGFQVNSAVSYFLKSYEDDGLGLLTGIIFAGDAMGNISSADLAHLLNRLGQLEQELLSAIETASEPTIKKARKRFETIRKRIEQGTDVIRRIAKNQDMDRETHKLGQKVAHAQSRLVRVTSLFQRAMNDIDRQRMHLGSSGISTSDLNQYLMNSTNDGLTSLLEGSIGIPSQPTFILSDLLIDVAEYELVEREREEQEEFKLPDPINSPEEENILEEDNPHLISLVNDIAGLKEETVPLKSSIPKESFEVTSYRLSMLSLADAPSEAAANTSLTELVNLPIEIKIEHGSENVMRDGVKTISKGVVRRRDDSRK